MTIRRALHIAKRLTRKDIAHLTKALIADLVKLCLASICILWVLGLPELLADIACFVVGV